MSINWVVHRGSLDGNLDNNIESIKKSLTTSASGIELDVFLVDNVLKLKHDMYTNSTCTLNEAIKLITDCNKFALLDIKGVGESIQIAKLLSNENLDSAFVSSFNEEHLHEIKKACKNVKIGLITSNVFREFPFNEYDFVSIDKDTLTRQFAAECRRRNVIIFVWTIDSIVTFCHLKEFDVIFISDINLDEARC
jgi:glycerophosphoryl diester phosphodiesterase